MSLLCISAMELYHLPLAHDRTHANKPFPIAQCCEMVGVDLVLYRVFTVFPLFPYPPPTEGLPPSFPLKLSCSGRKNDLSPLDRTYAYSVFHPRCEPAWVDDG